MRLPTKPPGTAWLIAGLWNGRDSGFALLKLFWCLMGAGTAALLFAAWHRDFGARVAWPAGLATAAGTGLLILATSLNNETPYLLLVAGSMLVFQSLRIASSRTDPQPPRSARSLDLRIALWSLGNALACLVRVEHVLFFLLASGLLVHGWWREPRGSRPPLTRAGSERFDPDGVGWRRVLRRGALCALCFLLPLGPWEIAADRNIARVNREVRPTTAELPESIRQLEARLRSMPSDEAAARESRKLPGFARRLGTDFVAATVLHRGGATLRGQDFEVLDEAFGYRPEPLARLPFVTSYGPLNFFQANHPHATGGFSRLGLDDPPPLAGGRARYPEDLLLGPPAPGTFSLTYPPHLRAFNRGYAVGTEWIRRNPGAFARLVGRKLAIFWSGASLGFTGFGIPTGQSGIQRAVDLVTPTGWRATGWALLALGACGVGLATGWRNAALWPWLLFFASKVIITVLFFGYARIGATVTPVVFLLASLALDRFFRAGLLRSQEGGWRGHPPNTDPAEASAGGGKRSRAVSVHGSPHRTWIIAVVTLLILIEAFRCLSGPSVRIDGKPIETGDPFAGPAHLDRRIEAR